MGAVRLGRSFLELRVEDAIPDFEQQVMVMCAGGVRSLFAAETLKHMGYRNVRSIAGGFSRWKNEGHPFEIPATLDAEARERYSRHLLMPDVGEKGQIKLLESKVLLIGAGGLGSPSAYYLAAAGVGTLGLVDHDVVDRSNLQRQILHAEDRVGMPKVKSATIALQGINPKIRINAYETHLDSSNVEEIFSDYDVIVDGSDNLVTRYLVNDACVKMGKPNVHAAVYRFEGQITVFWPAYETQQRLLPMHVPRTAASGIPPSCAEAGVLGVMPGTLGLLQAVETIKILLGLGQPLVGRMLHYDALSARFTEMKVRKNPKCRYCAEGAVFPDYQDYAQVCASDTDTAAPRQAAG